MTLTVRFSYCIHHFDKLRLINMTNLGSSWMTTNLGWSKLWTCSSKWWIHSSTWQTYGCHLGDEADEGIFVILTKESFSVTHSLNNLQRSLLIESWICAGPRYRSMCIMRKTKLVGGIKWKWKIYGQRVNQLLECWLQLLLHLGYFSLVIGIFGHFYCWIPMLTLKRTH
jgi:hypothetical protein